MEQVEIVHQWGRDLLRNLGPSLDVACYNQLFAAIAALENKLKQPAEEVE